MDARIFWLICCLMIAARCAPGQDGGSRASAADTAGGTVATETVAEALLRGDIDRFGATRFRPGEDNLAVGILQDKQTVVITKVAGRLQHFDLRTGRLTRETRYAKSPVYAAVHTADGRYVAAMGEDF